ncbi:MAG: T9SS type A sorting domain-containing protein [Fibrobacteres bacterium]|nr:T9SS type A sorting domain-containing protein [Fibrobacterota bacterium]
MKKQCAFLLLLAITAVSFSAPSFISKPAFVQNGGSSAWTITFQLNENCDVEVAIIDTINTKIVRHLAAGVLGTNPPPPLAANSLSQTLVWDGKDDFGKSVANTNGLTVRVRAGISTSLTNIALEDLYSFQGSGRSTPSLLFDKTDGTILMLGQNNGKPYLRKYDAAGNYSQTIYPLSGKLSADSVTSYGINLLAGAPWIPKTTAVNGPDGGLAGPIMTSSMLNSGDTRMISLSANGEIVLINGMNMSVIKKNGAFTGSTTQKIITSPAGPAGYTDGYHGPFGPQYFTSSANPEFLYVSGWFYANTNGGGWLTSSVDTGFWADGQVLRVNRTTGVVTKWLKLDSVPTTAADRTTLLGWGTNAISAVHGVAIDDSGHVFVCDRLHKRIGVYDTNAVLLGSIPCVYADYVSVSKRTGAVYVLKRNSGLFTLVKYDGWRGVTAASASISLTTSVDGYKGAPVMELTENGNSTNIWVGYGSIGFRLYADAGSSFNLIKDFSVNAANAMMFERIAVDKSKEKVYIHSWNRKLYSISDWSTYQVKQAYNGTVDNITVAPNGYVYGFASKDFAAGSWSWPVLRFKDNDTLAAENYPNTGRNVATNNIGFEGGWPGNHRGIAVGWQDNLAAYEEAYYLWGYKDTGTTTTTTDKTPLLTFNPALGLGIRWFAMGVKFDPAGNLYAGIATRGTDAITPTGLSADSKFGRSGSVVKYAPNTTGTVTPLSMYSANATVAGHVKIYPQPFGPFAGDNSSACNCRNSYFDVDPYGRLFIPNGTAAKIYIADNAGNTILEFGQYGNTDARGTLTGAGQYHATADIPMAWPTSVATSEDYLYIADAINCRLLRVKMNYALNSTPAFSTQSEKNADWKEFKVSSKPNPFNPTSRLNITLPAASEVRASIYTADGKLVYKVVSGRFNAGNHSFIWNGVNSEGKKVTSGLYVYRITAGNRTYTLKTIMSK